MAGPRTGRLAGVSRREISDFIFLTPCAEEDARFQHVVTGSSGTGRLSERPLRPKSGDPHTHTKSVLR